MTDDLSFTPCKPPVRRNDFLAWLQVVVDGALLASKMRDEAERAKKTSLNELRKRMQK